MDDPSSGSKLPPIIIRSPRSLNSSSFERENFHQNVKTPTKKQTRDPDEREYIKPEIGRTPQASKIRKKIIISLKNDENWSPTVLVIGPGGMKGFLELGALAKLEEEHVLDNVGTYFGVSVGSIICLLRTIGYTYQNIAEIGSGLNLFNGWDDINLTQILHQNGVIPHEKLRIFLSGIVKAKMGLIPTFKELYTKTGYILKVVSYNITTQTTYYFDYRTHPDASVIEIVLASSSIPLLFYKFKYGGDYYCDGAIGNPYPVDKVDDGTTDILGIYISSTPDRNNQENFHWYLDRIIHATMSEYREHIIKNSTPRCKHLALYSDIKDVTGMAVNNELRISMFNSGYKAASKFLNREDDIIIVESKNNNPIPYVPSLRESKKFSSRTTSREISASNILGLYTSRRQINHNQNIPVVQNNIVMSNRMEPKILKNGTLTNKRSSRNSSFDVNNYQAGNGRVDSNEYNSKTIQEIENRVMKKLVPLIISRTIKPTLRASNGSTYSRRKESSRPLKSYLDCLISSINIIPPAGKTVPLKIYRRNVSRSTLS
uniref:Patatin-like phospholipase n=1 Tax=Pithovirus LCPAC202 TaxID=2506592 RepID=A0A481Z654_9VIRU|nr:MAG: patatin-like phospholipase [Pithovirus LCPAC202]